jgi:hypothetical protein
MLLASAGRTLNGGRDTAGAHTAPDRSCTFAECFAPAAGCVHNSGSVLQRPSQASPGISVADVIVDWSRGAGTAGSAAYRGPFRSGLIDDDLRHADAEFHPLLQRNCLDGSVVQVGDPAHDREAEARAG